jgi:hypothetical protein
MMRVENNTQTTNIGITHFNLTKKTENKKSIDLPIKNNKEKSHDTGIDPSDNLLNKQDLKKLAREMLAKDRKLGSFEDKDQLGEATDLQIGPDIRYALTTKNPEFLKRIIWGPLTSAEFREVFHKLNELERKGISSNNILKGQIIDMDS